ncbi:hypothetical protein CHUAL_012635 [Chamberlinius hualienensis]
MATNRLNRSTRSKCIDTINSNLIENLKQFRANPVPIQTFLPLYQTMVKQQCLKAEISSILRKTQLATEQKPFNFNEMNYEKKIHSNDKRSGSEENVSTVGLNSNEDTLQINIPTKTNVQRASSAQLRSRSCSRSRGKLNSPKMTRAALLRSTYCKSNTSKGTVTDSMKTVPFDVRKVLSKKIDVSDREQIFAERLKTARIEQKVQLKEYTKQKQEMYERVKSRPLLVERQIQQADLAKLQKDYQDILKKEGLNADMIKKYSGAMKLNLTNVQKEEEESDDHHESEVDEEDSRSGSQSSVSRRSETYSHESGSSTVSCSHDLKE